MSRAQQASSILVLTATLSSCVSCYLAMLAILVIIVLLVALSTLIVLVAILGITFFDVAISAVIAMLILSNPAPLVCQSQRDGHCPDLSLSFFGDCHRGWQAWCLGA